MVVFCWVIVGVRLIWWVGLFVLLCESGFSDDVLLIVCVVSVCVFVLMLCFVGLFVIGLVEFFCEYFEKCFV